MSEAGTETSGVDTGAHAAGAGAVAAGMGTGQSRVRGNFVASMALQSALSVSVELCDKTGKPQVRFSMPEGYLDIRSYDEKTSGRLPLETIMQLKQWVANHWDDPYPSEVTKEGIAADLKLTKQQVSNWFRNERKRLWLPLKRRAEDFAKANALQPTPLPVPGPPTLMVPHP